MYSASETGRFGIIRWPFFAQLAGCALIGILASHAARAATHDLPADAASAVSTTQDSDRLGSAIAVLGDINGDGIDDFLIGAPASGTDSRAYVMFGRADGLPPDVDLPLLNGSNGFVLKLGVDISQFGFALTRLGDVNGDGHDDFAIGAYLVNDRPDTPSGMYLAGAVYVVFGRPAERPFAAMIDLDTLDGSDGFIVHGSQSDGRIGYALGDAGDFDGDGYADLLIGAQSRNNGQSKHQAWLVRGHAGPFAARISLGDLAADGLGFEFSAAPDQQFANALAGIGDLDGDGFDDIVIGAPGVAGTATSTGRVYVVHGRAAGSGAANTIDLDDPAASGVVRIEGGSLGSLAGYSVAAAGDADGDGVVDFLVGAPGRNAHVGAAYLVSGASLGSATDLDALVSAGGAVRFIDGTASNANNALGARVVGGVNLIGNEAPDLVLAMPGGGTLAGGRSGSVFVVPGRAVDDPHWPAEIDVAQFADAERWDGVVSLDTTSPQTLRDAITLAAGGDVNGDGVADLLIGSRYAHSDQAVEGPWRGRVWITVGPVYDDTIFKDGFDGRVDAGGDTTRWHGMR